MSDDISDMEIQTTSCLGVTRVMKIYNLMLAANTSALEKDEYKCE